MKIKFTPNIDIKIAQLKKELLQYDRKIDKKVNEELLGLEIKSQPQTDTFEKVTKDSVDGLTHSEGFEMGPIDTCTMPTDYDDIVDLMSHERKALNERNIEKINDSFREDELFDPLIDTGESSQISSKYDLDDVELSDSCFPDKKLLRPFTNLETHYVSDKEYLKLLHFNLIDQILPAISSNETTQRTMANNKVAELIIELYQKKGTPISKLVDTASKATITPKGSRLLSPELFLFLIKHPNCKSDVTILDKNNQTLLDTSLVEKYFEQFYRSSNGDLKVVRKIIADCKTENPEVNGEIYNIASRLVNANKKWTEKETELMKLFKENQHIFEHSFPNIQAMVEENPNPTKIRKMFENDIKTYNEMKEQEKIRLASRTIEDEAAELGIKLTNYSEDTVGYERLVNFKHKMLKKMIDEKINSHTALNVGWLDNKAVNRIMAILKYDCEHAKQGKTIKFDKAEELFEQNKSPLEIISELKKLKQQNQ